MSVLEGTKVPGTRLRSKEHITTFRLLEVLGPQLAALYDELKACDPDTLANEQRRQREWLLHWFEEDEHDRRGEGGVREL